MNGEQQSAQTYDRFSREQLEIYARELAEHVRRERELRQRLEQRVRELEALNRLFQRHLEERFHIVDTYRDLAQGLQRLAQEMQALSARANAEPIPERDESLGDAPPQGRANR